MGHQEDPKNIQTNASREDAKKQDEWDELWRKAKINARKIGSLKASESGDPSSNKSGIMELLQFPNGTHQSKSKNGSK